MPHSPYHSYITNEYLAAMNDMRRLQQFKALVFDDEMRALVAQAREKLDAVGTHKVAVGIDFFLCLVESGILLEDVAENRRQVLSELQWCIGQLAEILVVEGTQYERELMRAAALRADRLKIMEYVRQNAGRPGEPPRTSFKTLPGRWFDDWTLRPIAEDHAQCGYRWDALATDPWEDLARAWGETPDMKRGT